MPEEAVPGQDAAHVRMAVEADAEEVVDLALHPVRGVPYGRHAGTRLADLHAKAQTLVPARERMHPEDDVEARDPLLPVDRGEVDEIGERLGLLQVAADLDELHGRD